MIDDLSEFLNADGLGQKPIEQLLLPFNTVLVSGDVLPLLLLYVCLVVG